MKKQTNKNISFFEKYLTIWVLIIMGIGIMVGKFIPTIPNELNTWKIAEISIPIAILIWIMIYPVMLKIDFKNFFKVKKQGHGIFITTFINWIVKPVMMYGIATLFFKVIFVHLLLQNQDDGYRAGLIILAAAPCTAMVFVWSSLNKGNANFTLAQVILNDTILLIVYVPLVGLLLQATNIQVPWKTLGLSILIFLVIPILFALLTRYVFLRRKDEEFIQNKIVKKFDKFTMIGLMLTLFIIFMSQTNNILTNPYSILLISIPILIQTTIVFFFALTWGHFAKLPNDIIGPTCTISASNFFELALAIAISMTGSLFGLQGPATLAVMVGIIVEVPIMLMFVHIIEIYKRKRKNLSIKVANNS